MNNRHRSATAKSGSKHALRLLPGQALAQWVASRPCPGPIGIYCVSGLTLTSIHALRPRRDRVPCPAPPGRKRALFPSKALRTRLASLPPRRPRRPPAPRRPLPPRRPATASRVCSRLLPRCVLPAGCMASPAWEPVSYVHGLWCRRTQEQNSVMAVSRFVVPEKLQPSMPLPPARSRTSHPLPSRPTCPPRATPRLSATRPPRPRPSPITRRRRSQCIPRPRLRPRRPSTTPRPRRLLWCVRGWQYT
jgi:hypothetical protein